jgi:tRNA G18 (ribose-2'-O)-methylase SpoU
VRGPAGVTPIDIDDPDDPRIAAYRDIRERDLAGRRGLFVAEGKVVLEALFSARRFEPESALILDARLPGMVATLAKAPVGMPVYVASRPVMDAVAGFPMHRGVLAIGRRGDEDSAERMLSQLPVRALVLALVGISNHDNMGSLFRNAAAFGADAVLIDDTSCDPLYRKAIRVSVGAVLKVPFAVAGGAEQMIEMLTAAAFAQAALSPNGHTDIRELGRTARMALYLGTEGEGLPTALLQRLEAVRIPIAEGFDSLNVAAASAIALHEIRNR